MIRRANTAEIDIILAITKACAIKMISQNIYQWNGHYPSRSAFETDIKRNELYIYVLGNTIIACIAISTKKDEEYNDVGWLTPEGSNYYIHRLAVHPNHQGKGIAKQLMDFAENIAIKNNALSVRLDTFSKNLRNQKFYDARGYSKLSDIYFPKQSLHPFHCYELVLNS